MSKSPGVGVGIGIGQEHGAGAGVRDRTALPRLPNPEILLNLSDKSDKIIEYYWGHDVLLHDTTRHIVSDAKKRSMTAIQLSNHTALLRNTSMCADGLRRCVALSVRRTLRECISGRGYAD